jgi:two-component system, OmpR family, sensor histidine kinase CiaH
MKVSVARMRRQLTFWYVAIFAVALLAFGMALYHVLERQMLTGLERSLERTVDQRTRWVLTRRAPVIVAQDSSLYERRVVVFDADGEPFSPTEAEPWLRAFASRVLTDSVARVRLRADDEREWLLYGKRFRTTAGRTYATVAVADVVELADRYPSLFAAFLALATFAVLLLGVGASALARKATGPIDAAFDQMRRFMSDAAHELKTPVAVLRARAEVTLQRPRRPEEYEEVLADIAAETGRLGGLVENMLLLARADAGQWPIQRERIFLDDVLLDAASSAKALGERKGVGVEVGELQESAVEGDPVLLQQLVMILLDNAVTFTPADGRVTVSTRRTGAWCVLAVEDTGAGIAPGVLPHVFDRFFRGDAARRRGGAGLGLAIGRWIVESHGGRIDVVSEVGRGTTFTVRLPAV